MTPAVRTRRRVLGAVLTSVLCPGLIAGSATAADAPAPDGRDADRVARRMAREHAEIVDAMLTEPSRTLSSAAEDAMVSPVDGRLTSRFGPRSGRMHRGIDLAAPVGTPIRAVQDGTVSSAGSKGGYGNTVDIAHDGGYTTRSAHQSELLVHTGQQVEQGQMIGRVGTTGSSTGPHLHFELRVSGTDLDPLGALPPPP